MIKCYCIWAYLEMEILKESCSYNFQKVDSKSLTSAVPWSVPKNGTGILSDILNAGIKRRVSIMHALMNGSSDVVSYSTVSCFVKYASTSYKSLS
ncbi:unnamed protein product [Allacma fusca]|uniref:Uncharacterized protein n=1 Tax=Allacma fusca TaxID=39272 RepID=A0A8J2PPJ5_9HEXA|nr:unnamed protein product [Allacma fusca]